MNAFPVDPRQYREFEKLERDSDHFLSSLFAQWDGGQLIGLDLGEPDGMTGARVRNKHLSCLSHFTGLTSLSLRGNVAVTDRCLAGVKGLTGLRELILDEMQIGDKCLAYFGRLTNVKTLYLGKGVLRDNQVPRRQTVTDAGLALLASLSGLEAFSLDYTDVTGTGFSAFDCFPNLKFLFLEDTPFCDAGMRHVARMRELKYLHLSNTKVTDKGLECLTDLPNLEQLYLDGTAVTDKGLRMLNRVKSLTQLWVQNRRVSKPGRMSLINRLAYRTTMNERD